MRSSLRIPRCEALSEQLNLKYQTYLKGIIDQDLEGQITRMADLTADSLAKNLNAKMLNSFNLASLNGWASYTLFDSYLDGDGQADSLPMAMLALRRAGKNFRAGLPNNRVFDDYVDAALDIVDNATDWELANCRISDRDSFINKVDLPIFQDLSQLAYKSWGHTIASAGVLLAAGFPLTGTDQTKLRKFFFHYLIARQLNDDAHDWLADLQNRQFSFVVTALLYDYMAHSKSNHVDTTKELTAIQTFFWEYTIVEIINLVNQNLNHAREALEDCRAIKVPITFLTWLDEIQTATDKASDAKKDAESFISSFAA